MVYLDHITFLFKDDKRKFDGELQRLQAEGKDIVTMNKVYIENKLQQEEVKYIPVTKEEALRFLYDYFGTEHVMYEDIIKFFTARHQPNDILQPRWKVGVLLQNQNNYLIGRIYSEIESVVHRN